MFQGSVLFDTVSDGKSEKRSGESLTGLVTLCNRRLEHMAWFREHRLFIGCFIALIATAFGSRCVLR